MDKENLEFIKDQILQAALNIDNLKLFKKSAKESFEKIDSKYIDSFIE